jgi:hypothetical protein
VSANESSYESSTTVERHAGENVTLVCVSNMTTVNWLHVDFETAEQRKISGKNDDSDRTVSGLNGNYTLFIRNAQANDGGWYICVEEDSVPESFTTVKKHLFTVLISGKSQF